ncbi:MAG: ABC transporter substrate-binding protein [Bdellovibrionota bacterium]
MMGLLSSFFALHLALSLGIRSESIDEKPKSPKIKILSVFAEPERPSPDRRSAHLYGFELALGEHTELKEKIEILDISLPRPLSEAASVAQNAIQTHKPDVIIGGSTSNHAFVLGELADQNQIPFVTPWATHPDVTRRSSHTFRTCFNDHYQATKLVDFIMDEKSLRSGLILTNEKESFSVGFSQIFENRFKEKSGKKLHRISYRNENELTTEDFKKLEASKIEFVVIPTYEVEAAAIVSKLGSALSKGVQFFGPDSWGEGRIINSVLQSLPNPPQAYVVSHWSADSSHPSNQKFLNQLQAKNFQLNERISLASIAMSFDALQVVLNAIRVSDNKSKSSILSALKNTDVLISRGRLQIKERQPESLPLFINEMTQQGPKFVRAF